MEKRTFFEDEQAMSIAAAVQKHGGLLQLKSRILDETVYIAADQEAAKKVPERESEEDPVVYTVRELELLVDKNMTADTLQRLHYAKKLFDIEFIETPELHELPLMDPRPDMEEDSAIWEMFLEIARKEDYKLARKLFTFRATGLRLKRGKNGWVMRPEIGTKYFESQEEYEELKNKWLAPEKNKIKKLLQKLPVRP